MLVLAPLAYLWREWPPWELRAGWWSLEGQARVAVLVGLLSVYTVLAWGPTRQLVASQRLVYWRQCPIRPSTWRVFHGLHLLLLHGPVLVALGYLLMPAGLGLAVSLPVGLAGATLAPLAWWLGHPLSESRARSLRMPPPRSKTGAMVRVLVLALLRRRPAALGGTVVASGSLGALGWVATSHVLAAGEPPAPAAWGFGVASISLGAAAVWMVWPLLRREQWWFDSVGTEPRVMVWASVGLGAVVATPGWVGAGLALGWLPPLDLVSGVAGLLATAVWSNGMAFALDAAAVARREPKRRRDGRLMLTLVLPIPLATWHPLFMLVPAVLAPWIAQRWGARATGARRRFELGDLEDDHG